MRKLTGHDGPAQALAFSPDGAALASCGRDGRVTLSAGHGPPAAVADGLGDLRAVAFLDAGRTLVAGGKAGLLHFWEMPDCRPAGVVKLGAGSPVAALAALEGSHDLAVAVGEPGTQEPVGGDVHALTAGPRRVPLRIFSGQFPVQTLTAHPETKTLAWAAGRQVCVQRLADQRPRAIPQAQPVGSLSFSPDGALLAAASVDYKVRLLDALAGREAKVFAGHKGRVRAVAFHPGGQLLLSASWDKTVRLWDVGSGREVTAFDFGVGQLSALAVAPDGLRAAAGGAGGELFVWDLEE